MGAGAEDLLDDLGEGQILTVDRAYDSNALRQALAEQGALANLKPVSRRKDTPAFTPFLYGYRNLVERFLNKRKHFRASATRYEKERLKLPGLRQARIRPHLCVLINW